MCTRFLSEFSVLGDVAPTAGGTCERNRRARQSENGGAGCSSAWRCGCGTVPERRKFLGCSAMASPDQVATGMKVMAKGVQVQSSLTEAQKQQDSSLTCGGASSCMADWTLHFCGFFKDCLVTPKHMKEVFDAEHLFGKGHFGLSVPLKGWICLNFYVGLVYDVLEALLAFMSLELMTFLPGFISAVLYTTLGSYTWYWACIAGTNVGCCVLWIKLLVGLTVVNLGIQLLDIVRDGCDVVQVSEETGEETCDDNALIKFFRNVCLLITCESSLCPFPPRRCNNNARPLTQAQHMLPRKQAYPWQV